MISDKMYFNIIMINVIRNIGHMISNSVYFFRIAGDVISYKMNLVWIFGDVIRNACKFRLFWREVDFNTLDAFSQIIFLKSNFFEITQRQKQCFKNLMSVSKKNLDKPEYCITTVVWPRFLKQTLCNYYYLALNIAVTK